MQTIDNWRDSNERITSTGTVGGVSFADSEYYAVVRGVCFGLGVWAIHRKVRSCHGATAVHRTSFAIQQWCSRNLVKSTVIKMSPRSRCWLAFVHGAHLEKLREMPQICFQSTSSRDGSIRFQATSLAEADVPGSPHLICFSTGPSQICPTLVAPQPARNRHRGTVSRGRSQRTESTSHTSNGCLSLSHGLPRGLTHRGSILCAAHGPEEQ